VPQPPPCCWMKAINDDLQGGRENELQVFKGWLLLRVPPFQSQVGLLDSMPGC